MNSKFKSQLEAEIDALQEQIVKLNDQLFPISIHMSNSEFLNHPLTKKIDELKQRFEEKLALFHRFYPPEMTAEEQAAWEAQRASFKIH